MSKDMLELNRRAFAILHRMQVENTGWRSWFKRWYYSDEPLRNDAAALIRQSGFAMLQPLGTKSMAYDDRFDDLEPKLLENQTRMT